MFTRYVKEYMMPLLPSLNLRALNSIKQKSSACSGNGGREDKQINEYHGIEINHYT